MKKLCTKWFRKWATKAKLDNSSLLDAIADLENGLSVSDLGGNLFKIRVKREGSGKSSGFRTIVIFKKNDKAIFLYGFGKNEKSNISNTDLRYFKKLGNDLLSLNPKEISNSIDNQILFNLEVTE